MDNLKQSGIYQIRNTVNNKVYVGSSSNLQLRKNTHFRNLRGNYHDNQKLQRAFNKYGEDAFVFEILELVEDLDTLLDREQYYINTLNVVSEGYNICPIAVHTDNYTWTSSQKASRCGAGNPMFGKHLTEEHKKKISMSEKGRIPWNKGKSFPEEFTTRQQYNGKRKPVICVETGIKYISSREASRQTGVSHSHIGSCCRGERKSAGGYHWNFAKEVYEL